LATSILQPLAEDIRGMRLLIVPDGALHYVPFAALPDASGKPLIADHEIAHLQSATLLDTLRRTVRPIRPLTKVAVFADPVFQRRDPRFGERAAASRTPAEEDRSEERWARNGNFQRLRFSRKEADAIFAVANRRASLEALDFRASKQALTKMDLRNYGIIHFATHGVVDAEEPDLSSPRQPSRSSHQAPVRPAEGRASPSPERIWMRHRA
jgi:CHAT domain-containing protein